MAWIKASQEIEGHWKLQDLCLKTGWDPDVAMSRLIRFWWWVQKYAEDGNLSRFNGPQIDLALRLPAGTNFLEILTQTQWVDSAPYLRVHDWWDHNGPYLQAKYKQYPNKWHEIKDTYKSDQKDNRSLNGLRTGDEQTDVITSDLIRSKKSRTALRARKSGKSKATKTAPLRTGNEPDPNGSNEPSEDLAQVIEFIQANLPADAAPLDLAADWDGHTLETETERYRENGIKAAWKIFTGAAPNRYAIGQRYSTREFLRQLAALTDQPEYAALNRGYREEIMRRFAKTELVQSGA